MVSTKRFIAAALSILVGTFGYTIVDSTIENRISFLESEVVELREEVSKYHSNNDFTGIDPTLANTQHDNQITEYFPIITTCPPITVSYPTTGIYPAQGDFLYKDPDGQTKFLFRKYSNGSIRYVSVDELNHPTVSNEDPFDEYYLYVIDSSAQILSVEEETTYNSWHDNDYSIHTSVFTNKKVIVSVDIEGYTDPVFAGKKLKFSHYSHPQIISINRTDTLIRSDGSFSYHAEYIVYTADGMNGQNSFYNPTIY